MSLYDRVSINVELNPAELRAVIDVVGQEVSWLTTEGARDGIENPALATAETKLDAAMLEWEKSW